MTLKLNYNYNIYFMQTINNIRIIPVNLIINLFDIHKFIN